MRLATVNVPGWGQCRTYTCSVCGTQGFLGPAEASPGFGPVDEDALDLLIVGDPPRCPDCRGGPVP